MDGWPGIPHPRDGASPSSRPGGGLPAPGSTVVAAVEEDLGDGVYALRWAGQRISVFSRAPLQPGQALLLKSELSPEGKPRLVVLGPAPQTPPIAGRVIYGQGDARRRAAEQEAVRREAARQDAASRPASREASAARPQGVLVNTNSDAGGGVIRSPQEGGAMAAGVGRAEPAAEPPGRLAAMVGQILEPLPERRAVAAMLLDEAAREKAAFRPAAGDETPRSAADGTVREGARTEGGAGRGGVPDGNAPGAGPAASAASSPSAPSASSSAASSASPSVAPLVTPSSASSAASPAVPPAALSASSPVAPLVAPSVTSSAASSAASPAVPPAALSASPPVAPLVTPSVTSSAASSAASPAVPPAAPSAASSVTPLVTPSSASSAASPAVPPAASPASPPAASPAIYPATSPATSSASSPAASPPHQNPAPPSDIKPEALFREALGQMVKAAEFPLGAPAAGAEALGASPRVPDAVLDKAAAILLRSAGLTPDPAAMEAAKALMGANAPVDRETVRALTAVTAGEPDDARRAALLKAAARQLAKDIPLSAPLASGLADIIDRKAGVRELMDATMRSLTPDPALPEAAPLLAGAKELLDLLHVDLDRPDAAAALERYVSTFGRNALGKALALVETSAQARLESVPLLGKIDQALTLLYVRLRDDMELFAGGAGADGGTPSPGGPSPAPGAAAPEAASAAAAAAPPPGAARPGMAINAYLNAPRALPVEEILKNLPPMPKVVSLDTPSPAIVPGQTAHAGVARPPMQPFMPPLPAPPPAAPPSDTPARLFAGSEPGAGADGKPVSDVLMTLGRLFQTPGLNRPELELLRPGGLLDQYLGSGAAGRDGGKVGEEAAKLLRELLSDNPVEVAEARRELPRKEPAVLRETAARLTKMEAEAVRNDPVLNRLADAASGLRDLGRQVLAVKAENVAGQERNPGVMLAEVPFRLHDDAGDGRMQMFYRRAQGKGDGWTSRVILDLNTTRLGSVLGDMRFFGQDMLLNLFAEDRRATDHLAAATGELAAALGEKGFRLKSRVMVLPPPLPPPALHAERPAIAGEPGPADPERGARLDIEM